MSIPGITRGAGARHRGDVACGSVDFSDDRYVCIGDEYVAVLVHCHANGIAQRGAGRSAAVTGISIIAAARHQNKSARGVDLVHLRSEIAGSKVDIARSIEGNRGGLVNGDSSRGLTADIRVTGDGADDLCMSRSGKHCRNGESTEGLRSYET